jgi:site-specific DNA-adenine methylase
VPRGTVVYIDPPYLNTTGYKADFTRAQVCETAERWATAGSR